MLFRSKLLIQDRHVWLTWCNYNSVAVSSCNVMLTCCLCGCGQNCLSPSGFLNAPWCLSVVQRWANVCENTSVNMLILGGGGSAKGWLTPDPLPLCLWYCSHVNGSVRQYPVFLTSWTRTEAPWHPETPNTSPTHFKNTHTLIFGGMQPLNYFSGLNLRRLGSKGFSQRARSQDAEEWQERKTEGDRIFKGVCGVKLWKIDMYTHTHTHTYKLLCLSLSPSSLCPPPPSNPSHHLSSADEKNRHKC